MQSRLLPVATLLIASACSVPCSRTATCPDAGFRPDSGQDDSGADSGIGDGGAACRVDLHVLAFDGHATAIRPNGGAIVIVGSSPNGDVTSFFWYADGGMDALTKNVRTVDGGVVSFDGGFFPVTAWGLSANFVAGAIPVASGSSGFTAPLDGGPLVELPGSGACEATAVNASGAAVGTCNGEPHVWNTDGGELSVPRQGRLVAIDDEGTAVGFWNPPTAPPGVTEAILLSSNGQQTALPSPVSAAASVICPNLIVGGASLWSRPDFSYRPLNTSDFPGGAGVMTASADCRVMGGLGSLDTQGTVSVGVIWKDLHVVWAAEPEFPRVLYVIGSSADGSEFAADCAEVDGGRRPCRLSLRCE